MGLFRKKADPISERAKELNAQISALEAQIKELAEQTEQARSQPKVRSTTLPHRSPPGLLNSAPAAVPSAPVFEQINAPKTSQGDMDSSSSHYNDLGVRKYDLIGAWRRLINHFRGPAASNPRLVSYLAAGSIKGLRPLRYEKRVARNRFIFLSIFFVLVLWGLLYAVFGHR